MIQKVKTNREREREKERGKKRYLERVIEEQDAEQQIKEFKKPETSENVDKWIDEQDWLDAKSDSNLNGTFK